MNDSANLCRFVSVQRDVYPQVVTELRAGRKQTHWMWFIFPQIAGLGHSPISRTYALVSLAEAQAYLAHPLLGVRLLECIGIVNAITGHTAHEIFGTPDDRKFHSCLTLFRLTAPECRTFAIALERYYQGWLDPHTIALARS